MEHNNELTLPTIPIVTQNSTNSSLSTIPIVTKNSTLRLGSNIRMEKLKSRILDELEDNEKLMHQFIELLLFSKNKHDIHNIKRPCYKGSMYDQCEDCYSYDTENDQSEKCLIFFDNLSEIIDCEDGDDDDDDDDDDDGDEDDDEK